jgi:CheY-like chemotaxis protein
MSPVLLKKASKGPIRWVDPGTADFPLLEGHVQRILIVEDSATMRSLIATSLEDLDVPVPRPAGLLLEKLLTERVAEKGVSDLLVVVGLLVVMHDTDLEELEEVYADLLAELRYAVRSNLTVLSLMQGVDGMPDPQPQRARIAAVLARFEELEVEKT